MKRARPSARLSVAMAIRHIVVTYKSVSEVATPNGISKGT